MKDILFFRFFLLMMSPLSILMSDPSYHLELIPLVEDYQQNYAIKINQNGWIIGTMMGSPTYPEHKISFLWHEGEKELYQIIPPFQIPNFQNSLYDAVVNSIKCRAIALDLNNQEKVVGYLTDFPRQSVKAFVWDIQNGMRLLDLSSDESDQSIYAISMNNGDIIAGHYRMMGKIKSCLWHLNPKKKRYEVLGKNLSYISQLNYSQQLLGVYENENQTRPFIADLKTAKVDFLDLEKMGLTGVKFHDLKMNDRGVVAGVSDQGIFFWSKEEGVQLIGVGANYLVTGINNKNQIVGYYFRDQKYHVFVYDPQFGVYEPSVDETDFILAVANSLNDKGQIVGWGWKEGKRRGFLLTPN